MAWLPRSLDELSARVRGAFRTYMSGTDSALANNTITVIGKVIATLGYEFELRMKHLTKQIFLRTATGRWLEQHCADIGIYRNQAAAASGTATGTGTPGTVYSAGMRFVSGNITYVSTLPATAEGDGTLTVSIVSEVKAAAANRDGGGMLMLADPLLWSGVGSTFEIDEGGLGGGADVEKDDALKARGLQRKRNPPQGGSLADYERIALGVSGVLKAWAFRPPLAPGSVVVLFLFNGRPDFFPLPADVAAVQAAIDAARLIRVDDSVASAPVEEEVDVTIADLANDTPETRAAIESAIRAMFLARCRPGIAADTFTLSKSWISEAISGAAGEESHSLTAPAADIVLTDGKFPKLGTVSYT